MFRTFLALALFAVAAPAAAQQIDYAQRARDLTAISAVFGEMHHIRRMCEPERESEIWRDRMRRIIDLEEPQPDLQDRMVKAFNDAFYAAERRFPYCDRDARDYAAARAAEGDAIAARLTAPLYDALSESGEMPTVYRGGREQ